jgi:TolA-binding protein
MATDRMRGERGGMLEAKGGKGTMNSDSPLTYSLPEQALRQRIEDLEGEVEVLHLEIRQRKMTETMLETALERVERRLDRMERGESQDEENGSSL